MKRNYFYVLTFLTSCLFFCLSCAHKSGHSSREENNSISSVTQNQHERSENKGGNHTIVKMEKVGGVFYVPIKVNGLDLKFIFDTGASSISLSSAEALVMMRQGLITDNDIVGQERFQDATGGVSEGTVVRLKTVEIGNVTLRNVEASIVDNIQAPLLLGQTALSKFGKVTIDYNNNIIEFN